jgi:phage-related protein (TIGR01555 family)
MKRRARKYSGAAGPRTPIISTDPTATATGLRDDLLSAGLGVWGLRPQPTPEEIRSAYGPARTLGASPEVQQAADSQLDGAGVYSLIQHSLESGLGLGGTPFPGYPFLASLTQNGMVSACVDTVAAEMTRAWIKLVAGAIAIGPSYHNGDQASGSATDPSASDSSAGNGPGLSPGRDLDGNGQDDRLDALGDDLKKFKLQSVFHQAATLAGYYGGCLIFIDTGASGADLKLPLNMTEKSGELKPGALKGFTAVEPISVFPGQYNTLDPLSRHYFRPATWWIQSQEVHASRLIQIVSNLPPVILRPSYNFFGIPLAQILYDYVLHFQECRVAAQRLLTKFSLTVLQTDMSAVLAGGRPDNLENRVAYFVRNRSNDGCLVIDKDAENILNLTTPLSGVSDIVKQSLELIACIAKVPAVKLLGLSPSGFNATGESDLRNYYDHVASQQEKILRPGLETALKVLQLNRLGKICPDIDFTFAPLSRDDEQVQANIRKTRADTDAVYIQAGVVTAAEARGKLTQDPDSGFDNLNQEDGGAELEEELAKIFQGPAAPGPQNSTGHGPGASDSFNEEDHPRDEGGKFGSGGGGAAKATSQEEKQKKIDSVKIDFDGDNTLPGLNAEDLEQLGATDKPVLLKKEIIDKNATRHPDVSREDSARMIGQALYNPDLVAPGHGEKPYFNFIAQTGPEKNSITLLEVSETKDSFEIVNWHWGDSRSRRKIEKKGERIKAAKSGKEGQA